MSETRLEIVVNSPEDTARLGRALGRVLVPGDTILLAGPIGAGKTHFARHLVGSLLITPEDVPSPTYTLVQTYDTTAGELWHADLYRLTSPEEVEELGLTGAFDTAICLVEWPDRLGDAAPSDALEITFATDPVDENLRKVTFRWSSPRWNRLRELVGNA